MLEHYLYKLMLFFNSSFTHTYPHRAAKQIAPIRLESRQAKGDRSQHSFYGMPDRCKVTWCFSRRSGETSPAGGAQRGLLPKSALLDFAHGWEPRAPRGGPRLRSPQPNGEFPGSGHIGFIQLHQSKEESRFGTRRLDLASARERTPGH